LPTATAKGLQSVCIDSGLAFTLFISHGVVMIESSFCFLPRVGRKTERRWWRDGLTSWDDFLTAKSIKGLGENRKTIYDRALEEAKHKRAENDARYFGVHLPAHEHWRLYEWLRPRTVYLDIETNSFGQVTVVGLYGQSRYTSLIRGESLDARSLHEALRGYDLLVTFNGSGFDLPMLLAAFPDLPLDQPHLDLCTIGRQLGYRGGLKTIELQLGLQREPQLHGMTGSDAVLLWNRWRHRRDQTARTRLLAYNQADCTNLEPLADMFYCQMVQWCRGGT
jgi:uncharacterized protein YprB with RNaseH-like and TPR domain